MEFLKAIYGDKALTYDELVTAINAFNGNEANKDNQVKVGNLGTGEYVAKGKYDGIVSQLTGKQTELDTANSLIADLKKGNQDNKDLQDKITAYEAEKIELQRELDETKIKSAIKVALLSEKATEIDFLEYTLRKNLKEGEKLELDENDNIKGWDNMVSGLKTQYPTMFETAGTNPDGYKIVDPNKMKKPDLRSVAPTRDEFNAMSYEERVALKQQNEQAYRSLAK